VHHLQQLFLEFVQLETRLYDYVLLLWELLLVYLLLLVLYHFLKDYPILNVLDCLPLDVLGFEGRVAQPLGHVPHLYLFSGTIYLIRCVSFNVRLRPVHRHVHSLLLD
jgi:hypothetical protein